MPEVVSERHPAILRVTLENFLSFKSSTVQLGRLSVLVGPNGSGKTNLLRAFSFLGDVARLDLPAAVEKFGGAAALRWRAAAVSERVRIKLEALLTTHASSRAPDEYELLFSEIGPFIQREESFVFKRVGGRGRRLKLSGAELTIGRGLRLQLSERTSGLATLRRLGEEYGAPQVEQLASILENFRVVEIDDRAARQPTPRRKGERLRADAANLANVLADLREREPETLEVLEQDVASVLPGFEGLEFRQLAGAEEGVEVRLRERGLPGSTPLSAASFGTIRALALFALLHDPAPPALTCIEEIDHGLHPYALDRIVERLREAAERTQILVATHSPALVNRLRPEELVIFERDVERGCTRVVPTDSTMLARQMKESDLRLGELWFSGTLGGVPDA
ncbi:MAG: AAA family ATPase [Geminicoccaceae bacterium]|jgi:predicted ATPase